MKMLCPKPGKGAGKIHPSPVEDPIRAAFRLLPAAILVLVAGLGPEDREVLAYLVTLPVEVAKEAAPAVPVSEQPPGPARRGGGGRNGRRRGVSCTAPGVDHPPTHGCGCFECYMSFWARWDCSPERNRILDALVAFEEHLAAAESSATSPSSSKRRGRRSRLSATPPPPLATPVRRSKSPVPQVVEAVEAPASPQAPTFLPPPPPSQAPAASIAEEENLVVPEPAAAAEPEERREVAAEACEEERKRGWADVMGGVLGLRLWGIWSPAVESAT